MFKKTKIAAVSAAVLGLSSMAAQAVSVNEAGSEGEVLIFPYYNVNNGFVTSFNITNTTNAYKAVKVRFRESNTSNDVLDFNVYMSPFDIFAMGIVEDSEGGVRLLTSDKTCTHPSIPEEGVAFRDVYDSVDAADLREGYLEVIEMGEVSQAAALSDGTLIASQGILHQTSGDDAGMPFDCGAIENAWQQGVFMQGGARSNAGAINIVNPKAVGYPQDAAVGGGTASTPGFYGTNSAAWNPQRGGLTAPTGGLVGSSILVDTINVAGYVVEPTSVVNYSSVAQHYLSSDENFYLLPSLASGNVATATHLSDDYSSVITATWGTVARDFGLDDKNVLPRTEVPSGVNPMPIAHAMAVTFIGNQYFLANETATDWVIATPMRKHGIFNDYQYFPAGAPGYDDKSDIPVNGNLGDETAPSGYWQFLDNDDVKAQFVYWNREEAQTQPEPGDFSPPVTSPDVFVELEREVNIIALTTGSTPSSVLGSDNARGLTLASGFEEGWGSFVFTAYDLAAPRYTNAWVARAPRVATGAPISGFMAARGNVGDQKIGETFPHFVKRVR